MNRINYNIWYKVPLDLELVCTTYLLRCFYAFNVLEREDVDLGNNNEIYCNFINMVHKVLY